MNGRHHVVVGAGTAGFNAISTLAELEGQPLNVTLVSAELPYARMVLPYYLSSEIVARVSATCLPKVSSARRRNWAATPTRRRSLR